MNGAVFTDRDGVLNFDPGYLYRVSDFQFFPGVPEAIKKLNNYNIPIIVVTNQSGIGRGYFSMDDVFKLHSFIDAELKKVGAHIDDYFICPHHPDAGCVCRKPNPAMLEEAARKHNLDLVRSFLIGDYITDIIAGKSAGCKTILVKTGKGIESLNIMKNGEIRADFISENFPEAVDIILSHYSKG